MSEPIKVPEEKKNRRGLEEVIVNKALINEDGYRERLLADPHAVVAEEVAAMQSDATIPENYEIKIIEEPQNALYIVLPHLPDNKVELTDEDLENVAGGIISVSVKIAEDVSVGTIV
jgi:hypothetical protein